MTIVEIIFATAVFVGWLATVLEMMRADCREE